MRQYDIFIRNRLAEGDYNIYIRNRLTEGTLIVQSIMYSVKLHVSDQIVLDTDIDEVLATVRETVGAGFVVKADVGFSSTIKTDLEASSMEISESSPYLVRFAATGMSNTAVIASALSAVIKRFRLLEDADPDSLADLDDETLGDLNYLELT